MLVVSENTQCMALKAGVVPECPDIEGDTAAKLVRQLDAGANISDIVG